MSWRSTAGSIRIAGDAVSLVDADPHCHGVRDDWELPGALLD
jgi:hypothetical protein